MSARMKCMQSFLVLLLLRAFPAVKHRSALSVRARAQHAAFLLTEQETGHPVAQVVQTIQATAAQAQAAGKQENAAMQKAQANNAKAETQAAAGIQQTQGQIANGQDQLAAGKAQAEALTDAVEAGQKGVAQQTAAAQAAAGDRAQVVAGENAVAANSKATVGAMKSALGSLDAAAAKSKSGSKTNGGKVNGGKVNGGKVNGGFLQMEDPSLKTAQAVVQQLLLMPLVMQDISEDDEIDMLDLAGDAAATTKSPLTGAAPTAKPYQSKLGKVMNLIKKLMHKLEDKQHKADMAAMQTKTEYELAKSARDDALKVANESLLEKKKMLSETTGGNTKLQSEIDANKAELAADTKSLKDRQAYFAMKMEEFKERNYMRKRELEAMAFGVKILQQVAGVRKPSSMLQLETSGHLSVAKINHKKEEAVTSLRAEALRAGDSGLQRLADQLEASLADDGVGKQVDLMLQQKIWALDDEQLKDDEKKAWCDQEINKTKTNTAFKAADLKKLDDTSETLAADVESLLEDITKAKGVVKEKMKQMHEDRLEREEQGDEAKNTIHDAQRAQEALKKGIGVIQKFYQDAKDRAERASLIQTRYSLDLDADPAVPFDGAFTGTDAGGKGPGEKILKILEETQADFAQMEAETKAQDSADAAKFATNVKDAKTELATRDSELELKTQEKTRLWEKLTQTKDDIRLTDRQKAALGVMLKDLKKECDYAMFAERQANRTREKLSLNVSRVTLADAFNHSDVKVNASNAATGLAEQASPASLAKEAAGGAASKSLVPVPRSGSAGAVDWVIPDASKPQIEDTFEAMDEADASTGAFLRMPSQRAGRPPFRLFAAERPEWKKTPEPAVPQPVVPL